MISILAKGGWVMYPIILCSIFALAIILERLYFYHSVIRLNTKDFFTRIAEYVRKLRIKESVDLCEAHPTPLTNVLKVVLLHYDQPKELIKEETEEASLYEIPKLEKNLRGLATIAHVSPLLGLLGTVTGMVKCFKAIEKSAQELGSVNPAVLAGGIWEALITTVAGLIVAIPAFIAYNYFISRVNTSIIQMERLSGELLGLVSDARSRSGEV